jgi:hypothetical protein
VPVSVIRQLAWQALRSSHPSRLSYSSTQCFAATFNNSIRYITRHSDICWSMRKQPSFFLDLTSRLLYMPDSNTKQIDDMYKSPNAISPRTREIIIHSLFRHIALAPTSAAMLPSAGNLNSDRSTSIFSLFFSIKIPRSHTHLFSNPLKTNCIRVRHTYHPNLIIFFPKSSTPS